MCGEVRKWGGNFTMSPYRGVARALDRVFAYPPCTVLFCFDRLEFENPRRTQYKSDDRYRSANKSKLANLRPYEIEYKGRVHDKKLAPYSDEEIAEMTQDTDVNWQRLLNSRRGKEKLYDMVCSSILQYCCEKRVKHRVFIMYADTSVVEYPFPAIDQDAADSVDLARLKMVTYGEGDQLIYYSCLAFGSDTGTNLIVTGDGDSIVAALCVAKPHASYIELKRPSSYSEGFVVDCAKLREMYGKGNHHKCLTTAFIFMMISPCDYNLGFTRFGYTTRSLIDLLEVADDEQPFVFMRGNTLVLSGKRFKRVLAKCDRRYKSKNDTCISQFKTEVSNIMFTLALFSLFDGMRLEYGGPEFQIMDVCGDAETISEYLTDSTCGIDDFTVENTFPVSNVVYV